MNHLGPTSIDGAEISWFAPICDGDDDFLGNRNPAYKSTWENTSKIVKTADELDKETSEAELKNWQTQAEIAYWETRFEGNKIASLSVESINSMSADEVTNLVKAWNNYVGEGDPRYIARYGTRKAEVDGVKYPITRDGAMKPDPKEPKTWGIQKQPDGTLKKTDMSYEEARSRL